MASNKQQQSERKLPNWVTMKEDIVISGISGIFPDSFDMNEFAKNLYSGKNCVTNSFPRWPSGYLGLPHLNGTVPSDLTTFDAEFFGYTDPNEVNDLDFQLRFIMEKTHEAFIDAGIDPKLYENTNVGYFLASSIDESFVQNVDFADKSGFIQLHVARIPSAFNFHGPVSNIDVACGSSLTALHQAMVALRTGECDAAIVASGNICTFPGIAVMFHEMSMTSMECKCKAFDASADGYARSEALGVLLLQKKSDAKRVYCTVRHSLTNTDGYKQEGITFPKARTQAKLIRQTYDEIGVDPLTVKYMESHATGTKAGDPIECKAMADAMCVSKTGERRVGPLLVGALKSNIGHSEAASGMCAIAKVIISYENKCIPKMIHLNVLNPDIPSLHDGSLKPLTENTPFEGGLVSINNFGFGGANAHAVFESHSKEPSDQSYLIANVIPRLVLICGRTHEAVNHVFDYIQSNRPKITREFLALLNETSRLNPNKMPFRGSMILQEHSGNEPTIQIKEIRAETRPLYYLFTGMGSQWPAIGKQLMKCDFFAQTIQRLSLVLQPYGVDLIELLCSDDTSLLLRPIGCFVSIAAIQIAFVDLLGNLGITADGYIGHSIGEMGCAYADGALTAEQTILAAYWRAKCTEDNIKATGLMAAVGLSWDEIKKLCPSGIYCACNNSSDSVTISGNYEQMKQFMLKLRDDNIFERKVDSCDIAFHTPLMSKIVESLSKSLKSIGIQSKRRSSKWLSTTTLDANTPSDVSYYVNNLIEPVKFFEAASLIPKNAVVMELSPHSLFNSAIKVIVGSNSKFISSYRKNGNINNLLEAIGQLYQYGYNPLIEKLYPAVEWPVPRGTPFISPLIKYKHTEKWLVPFYENYGKSEEEINKNFKVNLRNREHESLGGHIVEGRTIYPGTGYLLLAWKTLANHFGVPFTELPVQFEDVQFKRATILQKDREVEFYVHYFEATNTFEIVESGQVCVSGRISSPQPRNGNSILEFQYIINDLLSEDESDKLVMESADIYKELRLRGYDYGPTFQGIQSATSDGRHGKVKWTGDWIAFADSMLQIGILSRQNRIHALPTSIELFRCDPRIMNLSSDEEKIIDVGFDPKTNIGCAVGIEIKGMRTTTTSRKVNADVLMEKYVFIPFDDQCAIDHKTKSSLEEYINACQIVANDIELIIGGKKKLIDKKDDSIVEMFLTEDNPRYTLIKVFDELRRRLKSNAHYWPILDEIIKEKHNELKEDYILNATFNCDRFIQPILDIILGNYVTRPIGLLELNCGGSITTANYIRLMFIIDYRLRYKLTVAHTDKHVDLENKVFSKIDFNTETMRIGDIGDEVKPSSNGLVIYRDVSASTIGKTVFDPRLVLKSVNNVLDDNGFLLAYFKYRDLPFERLLTQENLDYGKRVQEFIDRAIEMGYNLISKSYDTIQFIGLLFRKPTKNTINKRHFIHVYNKNFNWVEEYKKIQERNAEDEQIWLITNEKHSGIIGAVNCLKKEPYGEHIRFVFDENMRSPNDIPDIILKHDLMKNVFRDGMWGHFTHITLSLDSFEQKPAQHAYINVQNKGDLSSFAWFESPDKYWPLSQKLSQEMIVYVHYAPLNFKDIMLATGKLSADAIPGRLNIEDGILGLEFAGIDANGNRVMGMVGGRGMATSVILPDPQFLWSVPDSWTLLEASTVPCVYVTSYYALLFRAKLKRGERVLIHAGSGGVGLAAIAICLSMDCEVFTTVGSQEKRSFLKKQYPILSDDHILNSRDITFEAQILQMTRGRGVDVVLNSLSEDKLLASIRSLAPNGRFCEIGKFDLSINNPLDLSNLIQNKTFHGVLLDSFFDTENIPLTLKLQKLKMQRLLKRGIETGFVKPLPSTVFQRERVEEAFRYMSTGKHTGKVVLQIRDENLPIKEPLTVMAIPRTFIHPQKTIIITGGLGGFGLELAHWLAERGANKFVLTSRSGPHKPYHYYSINRLRKMGAEVMIWKGNGNTTDQIEDVIKSATDMGPVGGIFHLAMTIYDALMENQTIDYFERSAETKIVQCELYDEVSRYSCPNLEYFVVFSSLVSGKGNTGQTNYGFGNSACERIIESRHRDGFPGLAIQWGAIGDVGFVAEQMKVDSIAGSILQRMPSCFATLDRLLHCGYAVVGSRICDLDRSKSSSTGHNLMTQIAHILGVDDQSKLDRKSRLIDLGMDSLMGVEIKLALERDYNTNISAQEIRNLTIGDLENLELSVGSQPDDNVSSVVEAITEDNVPIDAYFVSVEPSIHLNHVKSGKPLFLLPSSEEQFFYLKSLSTKIMRPVYGINWTEECNKISSLQMIGAKWLRYLEPIEPNAEYDIIGYGFGGVVAIEMAIQLQKRGRKLRNVILLDSSPLLFEEFAAQLIDGVNQHRANINVIIALISKLAAFDETEAKCELSALHINSVDDRVKRAVKLLKELGINASEKKLSTMIDAFINKMNLLRNYVINEKYNGDVTLIRANKSDLIGKSVSKAIEEKDYGLSRVVNGIVNVIELDGDYYTFIKNNLEQIAAIINRIK